MIAELYAIRKIANYNRDSTLKCPFWASILPLVCIITLSIREKRQSKKSDLDQLQSSLELNDEVFKQMDCYSMLNILSTDDERTLSKQESDCIINSIMTCYGESLSKLSDTLSDNEKVICILHHLGVKPQIIAKILYISYPTVRTSKSRIKLKITEPKFNLLFNSNKIMGQDTN